MKLLRTILAILIGSGLLPNAYGRTPSADLTATPLPPMQLVIQKVMQTSADENTEYHIFNQHYSYTRDKITEFFNSSGGVTERDEKQSTNCPSPESVIPSPHPETHAASLGKQASASEGPNIHGVAIGKKEDLLNSDLLKRFKLTMVGREMINGRSALVVDFKPVSNDLPVFNIKDRIINSVAGRAWVDEEDFTLEKVDMHLTQKLTLLGGLIGSVSKFTFSFDRERTSDGYWFTRDMDWHLEAHEATVPRVVDHHEEVSNLQKMP
jgi:hypothetical protein